MKPSRAASCQRAREALSSSTHHFQLFRYSEGPSVSYRPISHGCDPTRCRILLIKQSVHPQSLSCDFIVWLLHPFFDTFDALYFWNATISFCKLLSRCDITTPLSRQRFYWSTCLKRTINLPNGDGRGSYTDY